MKWRNLKNKLISSWMITSILIVLSLPMIIGVLLLVKSIPLFETYNPTQILTSSEWSPIQGRFGFRPFILSSCYVSLIAFMLAAPVSILAGIYITQFASVRIMRLMLPVIDILAGLPSVVYGIWGVILIVPFVQKIIAPVFHADTTGFCILSGGIVLAVMCIPYILNMNIEVFRSVPTGLKEAVLSLGATEWEAVKHVVIPKSLPGIISANGLGIAKALGETMAVLMVVGNSNHPGINPLKAGYPLPALIANNYGEMLSIRKYDSALMFAALILFAVILIINLIFRIIIVKTSIR